MLGLQCDARDQSAVKALFDGGCAHFGVLTPKTVVFNIGANVPCSILEETPRKYRKVGAFAMNLHKRLYL